MKRLLAIVLCLLFVFSLAACGESEEERIEAAKQAYTDFVTDYATESVQAVNARVITDANGDKMLVTDVQNNSQEAISEIILCFAVWDAEGASMPIKSHKNPENTIYEFQMDATGVTVEAGATWSENKGIYLSSDSPEVAFVKAAVVSYKKADGTTYENPKYSVWKETYFEKTLEEYMR